MHPVSRYPVYYLRLYLFLNFSTLPPRLANFC